MDHHGFIGSMDAVLPWLMKHGSFHLLNHGHVEIGYVCALLHGVDAMLTGTAELLPRACVLAMLKAHPG